MKPYDKNKSFLSKVKNAVKDYFTPSWMQAANFQAKCLDEKDDCQLNLVLESSKAQEPIKFGIESEPPIKKKVTNIIEDIEQQKLLTESLTDTRMQPLQSVQTNNSSRNQNIEKSLSTSLFSSNHTKDREKPILVSPFYNGPVTYGGANAQQRQTHNLLEKCEDQHLLISKKKSNLGLSQTTQKILKILEKNQSHPTTRMHEEQKSPRIEASRKNKNPVYGPPVKQLQVPVLGKIKTNFGFMKSKSNDGKSVWIGKIKRDREKRHIFRGQNTGKAQQENETGNLVDIKLPQIQLMPLSNSTLLFNQGIAIKSNEFKFSSPQLNQSKRFIDENVLLHDEDYTFSRPKCKENAPAIKASQIITAPLASFNFDIDCAVKKKLNEDCIRGPKFLKRGSVMDVLGKDQLSIKENSCLNQPVIPLNKLFKKSDDVWCCPTCMVQNNVQIDVCSCCSTQKPSYGNILSTPASESPKPLPETSMLKYLQADSLQTTLLASSKESEALCLPSLSVMFAPKAGEWRCVLCMVKNDSLSEKCIACESPGPHHKAIQHYDRSIPEDINIATFQATTVSGFDVPSLSEMFAAKPGEWSCTLCMVRNSDNANKCAACETPKSASQCSVNPTIDARSDGWSCNVCMVKNDEEVIKCVSCETNKSKAFTGSSEKDCVSARSTNISINESGGFSFGCMVPFKTSDFGNKIEKFAKQDCGNLSGGFKPFTETQGGSVSFCRDFNSFGGGFHFMSKTDSATSNHMPAFTRPAVVSDVHSINQNVNNSNFFSHDDANSSSGICPSFHTSNFSPQSNSMSKIASSTSTSASERLATGGATSLINSFSGFSDACNSFNLESSSSYLKSNIVSSMFGHHSSNINNMNNNNISGSIHNATISYKTVPGNNSIMCSKDVSYSHTFNFSGVTSNSNRGDMIMESPQPAHHTFESGLNFENGSNSTGLVVSSDPAPKSFSIPTVNFTQVHPAFSGSQLSTNMQFNFGAESASSGNFTFSAGSSHSGRIIKRGTRRINKK